MSGYIGQTPLSKASLTRQNIIKTEPFTTLNVAGGYIRGNIDVYVNGVYIHPQNYTAQDGLTITFDSEFFAGTGDDAVEIEIRQTQSFQLADAYTKTETDLLFDPADPSAKVGTAAAADILGTVSQSGGVPTGAIIERGSNSNGEYVKFADGRIEFLKSAVVPAGTTNSANSFSQNLPLDIIASGAEIIGSMTINNSMVGTSANVVEFKKLVLRTDSNRWLVMSDTATDFDFTVNLFCVSRWY